MVIFILLWWDLNSGPPNLQSSSNPLFLKPLPLLFWPFGKIGWPKFIQLSPTSWKSSVQVPITYKLVYGEGWLHPVFQFPQSHRMGLQRSLFTYKNYFETSLQTNFKTSLISKKLKGMLQGVMDKYWLRANEQFF